MKTASGEERRSAPVAILVNGPSLSGKSTICRALQDRLTDTAAGNADGAFARVAFDDVGVLMSDKLAPLSFVKPQGGELTRLVPASPTMDAPAGNILMTALRRVRTGKVPASDRPAIRTHAGCFSGMHRSQGG